MDKSENAPQNERLFLLFAYPMGCARGGAGDMWKSFTNLEHAKQGILNYPYQGNTMSALKRARICGHVAVFKEGELTILHYFDPDQGWDSDPDARTSAPATAIA